MPETVFGRSKGITFSVIYVDPRIQLYVPEKESFPLPLRYIDVVRRTHTTLDGKKAIDANRNLSEPRSSRYLMKNLLTENVVPAAAYKNSCNHKA